MRVCILGPVITHDYYGGVAVFDEGLAQGFYDNGCSVCIATHQKGFIHNIHPDIPVYVIQKDSLKNIVNREKPDYIIASLGYAKYLLWTEIKAKKYIFYMAFLKKAIMDL